MRTLLLFIMSLSFVLFSSCNKEKRAKNVFKVKLVASLCAFNIVEIQDKSFYNLGMSWKDSGGKEYKNVFAVANFCDFGKSELKVNDVFYCRIIERPLNEDCGVCKAFMETPPLNRNIEVVK